MTWNEIDTVIRQKMEELGWDPNVHNIAYVDFSNEPSNIIIIDDTGELIIE